MILSKRLREILHRVLNRLMEKPKQCTIQLFHNDHPLWDKSPLEPVGSGVLLELEGYYFIITAAHVVQEYALKKSRNPYKTEDDYDNPDEAYLNLNNIGFINNQCYYPIQHAIFTNTEKGKIENNVDLAVLTIDPESALELKQRFSFLSISDIILKHNITTENRYHIYGYPAEWTDVNKESGVISTKPFKFVTGGMPSPKIGDIEYDERFNLLLSYERSKMVYTISGNHLKEFSPKGISGCGLWYHKNSNEMLLLGIMTEDKWTKSHQPLMMATRIDEAIHIIKSYVLKNDEINRLN